jgi:3-deoxy-D-manno-octulosonate 8-phosphate phosphatase KdsC-like HAD superfamily phosphatase
MASKKAKREAGQAKRAAFMAEEKARGLAAQESGRRSAAEERERLSQVARRINLGHKDTIDRIATAVQKKQIERELAEYCKDDVQDTAVMFNRGMRI